MILNTFIQNTNTFDATANANDIASGYTAYANGQKITGSASTIGTESSVPQTKTYDIIDVNGSYYSWDPSSSQYISMTYSNILDYIVATPTNAQYEYGEEVSANVIAYYTSGAYAIVSGGFTLSPLSATSDSITVTYMEDGITKTYSMPINVYPRSDQYLNGTATITNEGNGAWTMECKTAGTLDLKIPYTVDIFCVGGGGGGGSSKENSGYGGGGGGGYATLTNSVSIAANTTYEVTIGAGGVSGKYGGGNNTPGGTGGTSSVGVLASANGGNGALGTYGQTNLGGEGGNRGGNGGNPGQDGYHGAVTTKYFKIPDGADYAGGGGGGGHFGGNFGIGYAGGGNGGQSSNGNQTGHPGTVNTGGGGGGASEYYSSSNGGAGGTGVVFIRTHR